MAYTNETIRKVVKALKTKKYYYINQLKNGLNKKASISKGNKKIGKVLNVSLAPIICCGNCAKCKNYCYDIKACLQYENVLNARAYNTALMEYGRDKYFADINKAMDGRRLHKYFRYHVSGDVPDMDYFERMIDSVKRHPDFVVWTYTKMYWIVNEYVRLHGRDAIPNNFHIMFSKWDGLPMDNPYKFPVFACKLKNGNVDTSEDWFAKVYKCPGNCDLCKDKKLGCIGGMNTYADEH